MPAPDGFKKMDTGPEDDIFHDFEAAPLDGVFMGSRDVTTKFGEKQIHKFITSEGEVLAWGSGTMDSGLAKVEIGQRVFIEKGRSDKGRWFYEVWIGPDGAMTEKEEFSDESF